MIQKKVLGPDKTPMEIIPSNIVIGGPKDGEILYAPIVNMGKGYSVTERYSNVEIPTKSKEKYNRIKTCITTFRPWWIFSVIVC